MLPEPPPLASGLREHEARRFAVGIPRSLTTPRLTSPPATPASTRLRRPPFTPPSETTMVNALRPSEGMSGSDENTCPGGTRRATLAPWRPVPSATIRSASRG